MYKTPAFDFDQYKGVARLAGGGRRHNGAEPGL